MGVGVRLATIGKKATQYFKRRKDQYDLSGGKPHSLASLTACRLCFLLLLLLLLRWLTAPW